VGFSAIMGTEIFQVRRVQSPETLILQPQTRQDVLFTNIRSVDSQLCNLYHASLNKNTSSFWCKIVIVAQLHLPYLSQARTTWEETQLYHKWAQSEISSRILASVTPINCRQADFCLLAPNDIHCNYHSFTYSFPASTDRKEVEWNFKSGETERQETATTEQPDYSQLCHKGA
jgi:hypothetical protein